MKTVKEKDANTTWKDYHGGHVFSVRRNHLNYTAPGDGREIGA